MRKTLSIVAAAAFAAGIALTGSSAAVAAEPIPVTPQVVVIDAPGTAQDRVRPVQVRGITYTVNTGPGYAIVRANAQPGYVISVPNDPAQNPFLYNPHSEGATANIAFDTTGGNEQTPPPTTTAAAVNPPRDTNGQQPRTTNGNPPRTDNGQVVRTDNGNPRA